VVQTGPNIHGAGEYGLINDLYQESTPTDHTIVIEDAATVHRKNNIQVMILFVIRFSYDDRFYVYNYP